MTDSAQSRIESVQPELTVVVPTFNESENIPILLDRVETVLAGEAWEMVVVDDDSPDGTHAVVKALSLSNPRIRLIHRVDRKGLSSACLEGMLSSTARYVAVIDADLQHDESQLKAMLKLIRTDETDLIVASRRMDEGSFGDMPKHRIWISKFAAWLSDHILRLPLTDPMSGNFMLRRQLVDDIHTKLYGQGYKLLLDICVNSGSKLKIQEVPYQMRARQHGDSKLDVKVVLEYLLFLVHRILGGLIPYRFMKFCFVGGTGVVVHLLVLGILHRGFQIEFLYSQIVAVYTAMFTNYVFNNWFTFAELKRSGPQFWRGLISFFVICSAGAVIGVIVGEYLHSNDVAWWISGFATTLVAAVWNFSVSTFFVWRTSR